MNCPSRTDEPEGTGFNQNPNALAADLTTRQDLDGRTNSRTLRRLASREVQNVVEDEPDEHDIAINVDPELDFGENVTDNIGKNPFIGGWKTDNEL